MIILMVCIVFFVSAFFFEYIYTKRFFELKFGYIDSGFTIKVGGFEFLLDAISLILSIINLIWPIIGY